MEKKKIKNGYGFDDIIADIDSGSDIEPVFHAGARLVDECIEGMELPRHEIPRSKAFTDHLADKFRDQLPG